jgi:hypothetical protein
MTIDVQSRVSARHSFPSLLPRKSTDPAPDIRDRIPRVVAFSSPHHEERTQNQDRFIVGRGVLSSMARTGENFRSCSSTPSYEHRGLIFA